MILIYDFLWRASQILGFECDWNAVLIASADEKHILSLQAEKADINVCRNIYSCQVADVHTSVCIRKGCGNEMSGELLFHIFLI